MIHEARSQILPLSLSLFLSVYISLYIYIYIYILSCSMILYYVILHHIIMFDTRSQTPARAEELKARLMEFHSAMELTMIVNAAIRQKTLNPCNLC